MKQIPKKLILSAAVLITALNAGGASQLAQVDTIEVSEDHNVQNLIAGV